MSDDDTRTEQDKELELLLFSYVDEFPPIPGSYKEEVLTTAKRARELGMPDADAVDPLRAAIKRMHEQHAEFIGKVIRGE